MSPEAPRADCPYCGVALQLNEEARPVATHFEEKARALLGREALARRQAAMHARAARLNGPMIALVMLFALVIAWWFLAGVSGIASAIPVVVTLALVAASVPSILGVGLVWAKMMEAPGDEELGAVGLAGCSNCGAFIPFAQGEAVSVCSYCRAPALQPATLAYELLQGGRQGLREGQEQHAAAEDENWRTAREARVGGIRFGVKGWVAVAMVGAFAMTGALVFLLISGPEESHATWWIWPIIVGAVAASVRMVIVSMKRLMADNVVFERRFGVRLTAGQDAYRPQS